MKIQDHHRHFVHLKIQALLSYAITARKTNKINSAALAHHIHSGRNLKLRSVFTTYRHIFPPLSSPYQDQRPVLWLVIWNVGGAEVWQQTPERQGSDVSSSVRTWRRFEYSVVVASIQRKDELPRDYERMFRPPLRSTLPRHRRFSAPTHTKLQWTKPFLAPKPEARRCYTKRGSEAGLETNAVRPPNRIGSLPGKQLAIQVI
jgi:hypothetical protein